MNFEIIELDEFSGYYAKIYSISIDGTPLTLFDTFVDENENDYPIEMESILLRLKAIGNEKGGAREGYFKVHEGKDGDCVCMLHATPKGVLRLYCVRYGSDTIILTGGGTKFVRTWQEDTKLKFAVGTAQLVSKMILEATKGKFPSIKFKSDGTLIGQLKFYEDED